MLVLLAAVAVFPVVRAPQTPARTAYADRKWDRLVLRDDWDIELMRRVPRGVTGIGESFWALRHEVRRTGGGGHRGSSASTRPATRPGTSVTGTPRSAPVPGPTHCSPGTAACAWTRTSGTCATAPRSGSGPSTRRPTSSGPDSVPSRSRLCPSRVDVCPPHGAGIQWDRRLRRGRVLGLAM